MPYFEFKGAKLHYVELGNREDLSVVFVHGAGSSHDTWSLQMEEFGPRYHMVSLDLSGHGASDPGPEGIRIGTGYAYELAGLVGHLNLENFVAVGHSMGGGVVMSYALNSSFQKPKALVLVDTSSNLDLSRLGAGMTLEALDTFLTLLRDRITGRNKKAMDIIQREESMKIENPQIMQRDLAAVDNFDITHRLHEIDLPTLIIVGEGDDIITPVMATALKNSLPRADIAVVRNAHH
ncbi:MAG: alpha/beta fold hydrolase, partial [Promethearchaeota archaeon]